MTKSRLTPVATIIAVIMGLLVLDNLIAASMGRWGSLSGDEIAWRLVPLAVGATVLTIIWGRIRRSP